MYAFDWSSVCTSFRLGVPLLSDAVLVRAHAAMRWSPLYWKSNALKKYSAPPGTSLVLSLGGAVEGCSDDHSGMTPWPGCGWSSGGTGTSAVSKVCTLGVWPAMRS